MSAQWKMVPVEATEEMEDAGHAEYEKAMLGNRRDVTAAARRKWGAMLAAAPEFVVSDEQCAAASKAYNTLAQSGELVSPRDCMRAAIAAALTSAGIEV